MPSTVPIKVIGFGSSLPASPTETIRELFDQNAFDVEFLLTAAIVSELSDELSAFADRPNVDLGVLDCDIASGVVTVDDSTFILGDGEHGKLHAVAQTTRSDCHEWARTRDESYREAANEI